MLNPLNFISKFIKSSNQRELDRIEEIIKKIKCPYYLGVHKLRDKKGEPFIRVYDHKTAMMITLHGNLREYLESV